MLLGVEQSVEDGPRPCGLFVDAERSRLARPQSVEMLNSAGLWEPQTPERPVPLRDVLILTNGGRWLPAMQSADFMRPIGTGNPLQTAA